MEGRLVQDKIRELLGRITGKTISGPSDENLFESGVLDSFALTDLVAALEKEFNIRIPDGDLNPRKFESLDRIAAYVEERI
jgi:acyl carrier protein